MQRREYIVQNEMGLHARSVSLIARLALSFNEATISISCRQKTVSALHLTGMMALQAKQGDVIILTVEGGEEEDIADKILNSIVSERL